MKTLIGLSFRALLTALTIAILTFAVSKASAITITSGKKVITLNEQQITYLRTLNRISISINRLLDANKDVRNHDVGDYIVKVLTPRIVVRVYDFNRVNDQVQEAQIKESANWPVLSAKLVGKRIVKYTYFTYEGR